MKFSLTCTLFILAIGGAFGVMHRRQATELAERKQELSSQAVSLGISPADSGSPGDHRPTKRQRDDPQKRPSTFSADLIAFATEMDAHEKDAEKSDADFDKRTLEMMNLLMELDAAELKTFIANLRGDESLSSETRGSFISFSIMLLAEDHPAAALALYTESSDLLGDNPMGKHVVASSLSRWTQQDPAAALAWLKKNAAAHPGVPDDDLKQSILNGAAEKDPKLAFKLMAELQISDPSAAVQSFIETCKTPQQRTAVLDALRSHLASLPGGEERDSLLQESLETMGRTMMGENFDAVNAWFTSAKLTPNETSQFATGLSYFNTKEDTGRWIDWMSRNLPKDALRENIDNLVGQWTQQDYLAAGKWLTAAPPSEAKNTAVSTYAQTVAEYEPQTAVQWALTLPAGLERKSTFESIYHNWPKKDAAAAAAFAQQYGVDTKKVDDAAATGGD
jgi:hypothetical protein